MVSLNVVDVLGAAILAVPLVVVSAIRLPSEAVFVLAALCLAVGGGLSAVATWSDEISNLLQR